VAEQAGERCILDTNIVSYIMRGDTRAAPYRDYLVGKQAGISFQTVAELRRWAIERGWGTARQRALAQQIERFTIYFVDDDVITAWAEITARLRQQGNPITDADAWIAATATILNVPLVTHNRRHFERISALQLISLDIELPSIE
jgi:tRNA(fMet)-specific endonuclease VapC